MMGFPFNVRAYGVLVHEGYLLMSRETYKGKVFTKLPGGGLEFGEGLQEAVIREFSEETGLDVKVLAHLYTTDFFQASAFDAQHQVISVYFLVSCPDIQSGLPQITSLDGDQEFFWKDLLSLTASDFTFPIDQHIVGMLKDISAGDCS